MQQIFELRESEELPVAFQEEDKQTSVCSVPSLCLHRMNSGHIQHVESWSHYNVMSVYSSGDLLIAS